MTTIPKGIIRKLERCHRIYKKSDKLMDEVINWFDKKGHSDYDMDFQVILNEIQATGIEEYDIQILEEYLNHRK